MKLFRKLYQRDEGFTLVELLVVIAVLGILAGIAVPRFTGVKERANIASGNSALGSFKTALGMYHAEFDTYAKAPNGTTALSKSNVQAEALERYIDNAGALLGSGNWEITDYKATTDTFSLAITNDKGAVLTLNQSGAITESKK